MTLTDEEVIGRRGTVTVRIRGGDLAGEVIVCIRGGTESFIAYADEEIALHTAVLVYRSRGERAVDVTPHPEAAGIADGL
jgi:hypothetical protein